MLRGHHDVTDAPELYGPNFLKDFRRQAFIVNFAGVNGTLTEMVHSLLPLQDPRAL